MKRKDFLKLGTLSSVGFMLNPIINFATPFTPETASVNVTFYTVKDVDYDSLRNGFNRRINKHPMIVAVCHNTQGVQEAVLYANKFQMSISIKSGGHCMEGFSCGENSMQIILSSLNKIKWIDKDHIQVGPGCLLHELYEELLPRKKIVPGGSCATVGIGGLTLGGGYGLMSRLFGLTCDSLDEVTMVDGTGKIVNSKHYPELLWASKGGGNGNFGVITSMIFKVHDSPATMSSYRFRSKHVTIERGRQVLKEWFIESKKLPESCFSTCLFNRNTIYILLTNVSKPTKQVEAFITKMKTLNDTFSHNLEQPIAVALKNYYGQQHPVLFKNASCGLYQSFEDIEPVIDSILEIVFASKGMIYQINTLGGAIQDTQFETMSSFPHRRYLYFSELQTYWEQPEAGIKLMRQFQEVQQLILKQGLIDQYRNYPDIHFSTYEESYYGKNLATLKELKHHFDPDNVIRHEQSIRPK